MVDVQLGVHRHVVEDLGIVKSSDLDDALAGKGVALAPHGRAAVAATRGQNRTRYTVANTYQNMEVTSFPLSPLTVCAFGVPLVTLKPSSE